jgi:acyl CoA:acetate/3-ketoacid CoA transferase beta subunit
MNVPYISRHDRDGMKVNAGIGLITKPSTLSLSGKLTMHCLYMAENYFIDLRIINKTRKNVVEFSIF